MLHKHIANVFDSPGAFWRALRQYVGGTTRNRTVSSTSELAEFLESRASHVAQTALYGYLRTRAGSRYPELFESDTFMVSINIAKWQMWLACLSDLAIYLGGMLVIRSNAAPETVADLLRHAMSHILPETAPDDAGPDFSGTIEAVLARLDETDWSEFEDGEICFNESPAALVTWAPIIESLKELDREIVMNSVRFRWQEVRRDLRAELNAAAVLQDWERTRTTDRDLV